MALIRCFECGREVSDKAQSCVNCGCPIGVPVQQSAAAVASSHIEMQFANELSRRIKPSAIMWIIVASFQAIYVFYTFWRIQTLRNLAFLVGSMDVSSLWFDVVLFAVISAVNFYGAIRGLGLSSYISSNPLSYSVDRIKKTYSSSGRYIGTIIYNIIIFGAAVASGSVLALLVMIIAVVASILELAYVQNYAVQNLKLIYQH